VENVKVAVAGAAGARQETVKGARGLELIFSAPNGTPVFAERYQKSY
jgi:hypothetical protein